LQIETDREESRMIARMWRGWTATDDADEVAAHLRQGALARYAAAPGNVSTYVLRRSVAGGVELMTLSVWEEAAALPTRVEEDHRLLVARQTVPACWELVGEPEAIARAA
jgi:hypothetical protein